MMFDLSPLDAIERLLDGLRKPDAARVRRELVALRANLATAEGKSQELARAQANAVVRSGMIMAELQQARRETEKAREAAESASLAKSEFLASMSHDIRTPMNAVVGLTALALETDLTQEQREYLTTVQTASNELVWLINQILDLSKIEAGKLVLEKSGFDLRETLEEVVALFAVQAEERKVDLLLDYPSSIPRRLVGDSGRLRQVVSNLVGNATKFTHEGRIVVDVTGKTQSNHAVDIRISVRDTGIGIPSDRLPRLFDKYSQADPSTERRYGGTGLGLAICRELAELMGGSVDAASEEVEGSTFWVDLHLPIDRRSPKHKARQEVPDELRTLIVEREPLSRHVLVDLLKGLGVSVSPIESPNEIERVLREAVHQGTPYDHVILRSDDAGSPTAGIVRTLHSDPDLRRTRIIVTGGMLTRSEGLRFEEQELATYVVRPIREMDLARALDPEQPLSTVGTDLPGITEAGDPRSRLANARVLVAEDNPVNQMVARRMMQKIGFDIEIASDGRVAVERALEKEFDLIFMDCQMPELDGYGATVEIRRGPEPYCLTPIIALTAHAMAGERERCIESGMDDYISKPFKIENLIRVATHWLEVGEDRKTDPDEAAA